jgi:hypothetical protein
MGNVSLIRQGQKNGSFNYIQCSEYVITSILLFGAFNEKALEDIVKAVE